MATQVILAAVMAVFGVLGSQRGTRSALLTAAAVLGGLLAIRFGSEKLIGFVNKMNKGVQFFLSSDGVTSVKPLISNDQPGPWFVVIFIILVSFGLLLGQLKQLRGASSGIGLLLGLASGYLFGAYLLNSLGVSDPPLPLPFGLSSGQVIQGFAAIPRAEKNLVGQLTGVIGSINRTTLATVLAIFLALFFVLVMRSSGKGAKKG